MHLDLNFVPSKGLGLARTQFSVLAVVKCFFDLKFWASFFRQCSSLIPPKHIGIKFLRSLLGLEVVWVGFCPPLKTSFFTLFHCCNAFFSVYIRFWEINKIIISSNWSTTNFTCCLLLLQFECFQIETLLFMFM